ncbi:WYL domain-containing protein [Streptomyces sp. NPDC051776]|uniref:helix-turn-helix transcriptional regulator n=1 Tax=Streptomyces sp. NPDC051776 TaxID=3155414 RepID=UPI00343625D5
MRADRLLSLLLLLQNRGHMTAPELAAELEVSVRTVYRDIEALSASGVPVHADRGPAGGYRLVEGYRTRLTGLTDAEAGALFLVGTPGPARELGLGAVLATARLKLQAALPAGPAERTRRIEARFHLDAPGWFRDAEPVPYLGDVAQAVWDQRVLHVHYRSWSGEVHRELHPLGIVLKSGIWYVVARARPRATPAEEARENRPAEGAGAEGGGQKRSEEPVRTYRIARFLSVERSEAGFERPSGFDLAAHWEDATRRLEAARFKGTARLRISPRGGQLLPMLFGAPGARALANAGPADPDGWVQVEVPVESQTVAVGDLLRLGTDAEVLHPHELREAVARTVDELAARYGPPRSGCRKPPDSSRFTVP